MACQALGRCRICAKKHKIAVFGSEEAQHFFIQKANLKLIILNTVCVGCIVKIERFVKKMDLDMAFNDYIKDEEIRDAKSREGDNLIKKNVRDSGKVKTITMDVDQPVQPNENSRESNAAENCNTCIFFNDIEQKFDPQSRSPYFGDSQPTVLHPHRSSEKKIGQKTIARIELSNEQLKKRTRKDSGEEPRHNSTTAAPSSSPTSDFVDYEKRNCSSIGKKQGRFLWCDFCKKEFTHAGDLNKHRRKHTGEKPYECNQCERKFAHASNLARHQRVHSGERPFSCILCARTFTRKDKLTIHTTAGKCQINTTGENSSHSITLLEKTKTRHTQISCKEKRK